MADSDQNRPSRLNIEDGGQPYPLEKMTGGQRQRRAAIHNLHDKTGRVPPQAVEVEQSVLGAMLIENEAIPQAIEVLPDASAFYDPRHRRIYQAIQHLFEKTDPVDLITLTDELKRRDELEDAGGAHYLTELSTQVASAANVSYHARIIAEKALLRQMIETMTGLVGKAYDPSADAFELLDAAESDIFRISDTQVRKAATSMKEVLKDTLEQLESIHGQEGGITGVPSGFSKLDRLTSGWQDSDLIIVAARPSMGKTAFSLACGLNAATHPKRPTGVAIFSLEMGAQQLAQRLLTSEARVNAQAARTGRMTDDDWQKLARAAGKLSEAQVFIDDTPGLSVLELRAKARRLKAEHDIGLLIVDYLQLMHAPTNSRSGNREQEIAQISRSLKSLAKELDIPVIALSQLSRAVENRGGDKRPQLSDLRESGCLTGDTLVPMADSGRRVPMRELCGTAGFRVWAVNPDTYRLEKRAVTNAFCTGTKPVYRLQTQLGREVRATGNHKFLTMDGWKRLDALREGEHVALPRALASPAEQSMTTDELALPRDSTGDGCTLPHDTHVVPAMEEAQLSTHAMQAALGMSYCGTTLYKANMSRERAARVADTVSSEALRQLAESDVYWDRIASIAPDGVEKVYDLTVPGPQNFVANGIVVHNSIEQDADVVSFIYRAERYGITVDEHGNSTDGLAEIIIGKQRNGPIGTVTLAFVDQYARFENLTQHYGEEMPGSGDGYGDADDYGAGPAPLPSTDAPF
ncbi:MAG: replicative DNA helicase [Bacteroidetes bacterium]|jgi:replicative DNA helicase|nr:replicative DNA helicase [Bacteroidota bacterium]